jgi:pheromone shutdown protein TraB
MVLSGRQTVQELSKEFPSLAVVLLNERDTYMAYQLQKVRCP